MDKQTELNNPTNLDDKLRETANKVALTTFKKIIERTRYMEESIHRLVYETGKYYSIQQRDDALRRLKSFFLLAHDLLEKLSSFRGGVIEIDAEYDSLKEKMSSIQKKIDLVTDMFYFTDIHL